MLKTKFVYQAIQRFVARIFHNVHEGIKVTTARSHGLIIRTHQFEAEVPKK